MNIYLCVVLYPHLCLLWQVLLDTCLADPVATVTSVNARPKSKWRPLPLDTVVSDAACGARCHWTQSWVTQYVAPVATEHSLSDATSGARCHWTPSCVTQHVTPAATGCSRGGLSSRIARVVVRWFAGQTQSLCLGSLSLIYNVTSASVQ